jgi:hypothetical protein
MRKHVKVNRRNFLGSIGAVTGMAATPAAAAETGFITEPARRTRVAREVDVLVAGGGPTGVGAALAAAREGASVLVLERFGMLGGVWTGGLLNPYFDPHKGWMVGQLVGSLKQAGSWKVLDKFEVFDVEIMKYTLEKMMAQAGVEYWYHAPVTDPVMDGTRVRGAIVESKSGREAVLAKVVIDCSGDGDLAARAGVKFQYGRESDGVAQPATLMFEIDNIQGLGKLAAADVKVHEIFMALQEAIHKYNLPIKLPYGPQRSGAPYLIAVPRAGAAAIQATHVYRVNALDVRSVTKATVEARRQIHEVFMPALRGIPGMQDVRLTVSAAYLGIREARHLEGRYKLDLEDMVEARQFPDAVTSLGFGVDIHEIDPDDKTPRAPKLAPGKKPRMCDIPYRCLVPKEHDGLLFAGRCMSGSHVAHAAFRVTGTCMAMGQAAGLAAAMAVKRKVAPGKLDGAEVHAELVKRGATFLPRT